MMLPNNQVAGRAIRSSHGVGQPDIPQACPAAFGHLVQALNREYPHLNLRARVVDQPPVTPSRSSHSSELAYERLCQYYIDDRRTFQALLSQFRAQAEKTSSGEVHATLLLSFFRNPSSPVKTDPLFKSPIRSASNLTQRIQDSSRPRETTPESEEDEEFMTPPDSPSPSLRMRGSERSGMDRKRSSDAADHCGSAKAARVSISHNRHSSARTEFYTMPSSLAFPSFSTDASQPSVGSTVDLRTAAAGISFQTDNTHVTDRLDAANGDEPWPSSLSLNTELEEVLAKDNGSRSFTDSSSTSRMSNVRKWTENIPVGSSGNSTAFVANTRNLSSTGLDTRDILLQAAYFPQLQPPVLLQDSPSKALGQLNLSTHTSPSKGQISHQVRDLHKHGFFLPKHAEHSNHIPNMKLWWELTRISLHTKQPVSYLLSLFPDPANVPYSELEEKLLPVWLSAKVKTPFRLPSRKAWEDGMGTQLSGRLSFNASHKPSHLFQLSLEPIEIADRTCRFERKFGSDRFLHLDMPRYNKMPKEFVGRNSLADSLADWLDPRQPKFFLGRYWRGLRVEVLKAKKSKVTQESGGFRVVLFATEGPDIASIPISHLLNWFIDLGDERNLCRSFRKTFSRMDLGFTRTIPTIVFKPSQVRRVRDCFGDDMPEATQFNDCRPDFDWHSHHKHTKQEIMNDGNNTISVGAAREIWKALGKVGAIPTAFQGRIGGAKGVWTISGPIDSADPNDHEIWIKINDSQLKFEPHREDNDVQYDVLRWQFEVVHISQPPTTGNLHADMIPLLYDRGVEIADMAEIMAETLFDASQALGEAMTDPIKARSWVAENFGSNAEPRSLEGSSKEFVLPAERASYLLEHGLNPQECPYLGDLLIKAADTLISDTLKHHKIAIDRSCTVIGIPDPLGILLPGEIYVSFSETILDERTGETLSYLDKKDVLVFRHPLLVPSDIQKVRTHYNAHLSHLRDVVVFSVKGKRPLASLLQGGDYDGDRFTVCWDTRLTTNFKNAPLLVPEGSVDHKTFDITKDSRIVSDIIVDPLQAEKFLTEGFRARFQPVPLGLATNLYKKLVYALGYYHMGVRKLSQLHSVLIDADKNGYQFDEEGLREYVSSEPLIEIKKPPRPAYEQAIENGWMKIEETVQGYKSSRWTHPNDILFFEQIQPGLLQTLKHMQECVEKSRASSDSQLSQMYTDNLRDGASAVIKAEMHALKAQLGKYQGSWSHQWKTCGELIRDEKGGVIEDLKRKYQEYMPQSQDPQIQAWTQHRLEHEPSTWCLIKASALYELHHRRKRTSFIWSLAMRELCYIKASNSKQARHITAPMLALVKLSKKARKRMLAKNNHAIAAGVVGPNSYSESSSDAEEEEFEEDPQWYSALTSLDEVSPGR